MMNQDEPIRLERYFAAVDEIDPLRRTGEVTQLVGLLVESRGSAIFSKSCRRRGGGFAPRSSASGTGGCCRCRSRKRAG